MAHSFTCKYSVLLICLAEKKLELKQYYSARFNDLRLYVEDCVVLRDMTRHASEPINVRLVYSFQQVRKAKIISWTHRLKILTNKRTINLIYMETLTFINCQLLTNTCKYKFKGVLYLLPLNLKILNIFSTNMHVSYGKLSNMSKKTLKKSIE